jgi:hypothetical protein
LARASALAYDEGIAQRKRKALPRAPWRAEEERRGREFFRYSFVHEQVILTNENENEERND